MLPLRRTLTLGLLATVASATWADAADRYAVVELFTSQGCNSCPPADAALAALKRSVAPGERVIALEWHVDYWDYLGWPDPYGSHDASLRQRSYAHAMRSSMYTPQMVVNGLRVVGGAHRSEQVNAVVADVYSRSNDRDIEISVPAHRRLVDGLQVDYRLRGAPANVLLTIVVAEDRLSNYVPRGENAGRTLEHVNVVRGQASSKLLRRGVVEHVGSLDVPLPAEVDLQGSMLVALVHSAATQRVLAATWTEANG